ncbi:serine palmitoyltransferase small subunit A-like [Hetaerina americana]|uniref:serine palmitoyltransferase small subunit A-like n=1 Tax=Hetaerina americana TaxID=62018 RepID=UPI003A7F2C50
MFEKLRKWLNYWYFRYELITCIHMFEPWEKQLINSMILFIIALVTYSSYVYLPHYTMSLLQYVDIFKTEIANDLHRDNPS